MSLRIAIQMDPMETVDINADTTFAMAEAAAVSYTHLTLPTRCLV